VQAPCPSGQADGTPWSFPRIFHAGTTKDRSGHWHTAGGRVLGVCATGERIADATARAYAAVDRIHWNGMHCRRDIAWRAIEREQGRKTA